MNREAGWIDFVGRALRPSLDYEASPAIDPARLGPGHQLLPPITADMYSAGESEVVVRRALKEMGVARDRLVLATKVYNPMGDDPNQRGLARKQGGARDEPLCRDQGVGLIPWSPLARGFVAGNRRKQDNGETTRAKSDEFAHQLYYRDADFAVVDRITEAAKQRGVPNAQIAFAWLPHQPGVMAPIVGDKMQHLEDAVKSLEIELSGEELKRLAEPYQPHRVLGHG